MRSKLLELRFSCTLSDQDIAMSDVGQQLLGVKQVLGVHVHPFWTLEKAYPIVLQEVLALCRIYITNCTVRFKLTSFDNFADVHSACFINNVPKNAFMKFSWILVPIVMQFQI